MAICITYTRAALCGAGILVLIVALFVVAINGGLLIRQGVAQRFSVSQTSDGNDLQLPSLASETKAALVTADTATYQIERKFSNDPELMSDKDSANLTFIAFEPNMLGETSDGHSVGAKLHNETLKLRLFRDQTIIIRDNVLIINEDDDVDGTLHQKINWIIKRIEALTHIKLVNKTKTTARFEPIREFRSAFFTKASS